LVDTQRIQEWIRNSIYAWKAKNTPLHNSFPNRLTFLSLCSPHIVPCTCFMSRLSAICSSRHLIQALQCRMQSCLIRCGWSSASTHIIGLSCPTPLSHFHNFDTQSLDVRPWGGRKIFAISLSARGFLYTGLFELLSVTSKIDDVHSL
jgi:hypothetical protein